MQGSMVGTFASQMEAPTCAMAAPRRTCQMTNTQTSTVRSIPQQAAGVGRCAEARPSKVYASASGGHSLTEPDSANESASGNGFSVGLSDARTDFAMGPGTAGVSGNASELQRSCVTVDAAFLRMAATVERAGLRAPQPAPLSSSLLDAMAGLGMGAEAAGPDGGHGDIAGVGAPRAPHERLDANVQDAVMVGVPAGERDGAVSAKSGSKECASGGAIWAGRVPCASVHAGGEQKGWAAGVRGGEVLVALDSAGTLSEGDYARIKEAQALRG